MADLRDRTAALAGELADLRDQAQLSGDHELVAELKPLDRALVGERGLCTRSAHEALVAQLRETLRPEIRAEVHAIAVAQAERNRAAWWDQLQGEARTEAEAVLQRDREEVDRAVENLQAEAIQLEARDATITARENHWTRARVKFIALGAVPAVVLTTIIHAVT